MQKFNSYRKKVIITKPKYDISLCVKDDELYFMKHVDWFPKDKISVLLKTNIKMDARNCALNYKIIVLGDDTNLILLKKDNYLFLVKINSVYDSYQVSAKVLFNEERILGSLHELEKIIEKEKKISLR